MEAFRIEKKGIDIIGEDGKTRNIKPLPLIEGYVGHLDIVNAFVDYWDAQEIGTLSPVSVMEKREAMIKQIEKTLPVLTKLAQHDTKGLSSKLTDAYLGQSIGGDPVSHMSESYTRGLADTIHGLSTMYLGLKAGWSMDDVNLLSVFNSYAMSKDVNEYQTDKKPVYKDGEKEFIKKCSDYMKKVTSSPIKSASDRKNMLDELKALYKEGCDKEYIGTAYKNAIGFELDRIEKRSPGIEKTSYQIDMEGALKHFNTVRVLAFGKESDELKKVREAAEKVIRLKKELSGEKKAGVDKEGRSREVIESELKNAISDMNTLADSYISQKKTIPGSPAGKDRLYGAAELRMIGREMLNEMERSAKNLPGMELPKFKNKFEENASQAEIESLESVINQRKQKETEMRKIKENIDFSKDKLLSAAAAITITQYRNNKNVLDTNGKEILNGLELQLSRVTQVRGPEPPKRNPQAGKRF